MSRLAILMTGVQVLFLVSVSRAEPTFWGPTPYLSVADIPVGFYSQGSPVALEDFEDGTLDFGITSSGGTFDGGRLTSPVAPGFVDSVDADDGVIDGSGSAGESWLAEGGAIIMHFPEPVSEAAMVWTSGASPFEFEAFGRGMVSLGRIGPFAKWNGSATGLTSDDHFVGVTDPDGIVAIAFYMNANPFDAELDHVQHGEVAPIPVPALGPTGWSLCAVALGAAAMIARRRRIATTVEADRAA